MHNLPLTHAVSSASLTALVAAGLIGGGLLLPVAAPAQAAQQEARRAPVGVGRTLPSVTLDDAPIEDAIDFLRNLTGATIYVDWAQLELVGVDRSTPVNIQLQRVSVRKILELILESVGPVEPLTFYVDRGVIHVTTLAEADRQLITRVYPVGDLIVEVPNFDPPGLGFGGGGGFGGDQTGGGGGGGQGGATGQGQTREQRAQELIDLITQTVRPEIWQVNGGTATIRYFNNNLIVHAPRSVHQML